MSNCLSRSSGITEVKELHKCLFISSRCLVAYQQVCGLEIGVHKPMCVHVIESPKGLCDQRQKRVMRDLAGSHYEVFSSHMLKNQVSAVGIRIVSKVLERDDVWMPEGHQRGELAAEMRVPLTAPASSLFGPTCVNLQGNEISDQSLGQVDRCVRALGHFPKRTVEGYPGKSLHVSER
jgi:hypothetical protein